MKDNWELHSQVFSLQEEGAVAGEQLWAEVHRASLSLSTHSSVSGSPGIFGTVFLGDPDFSGVSQHKVRPQVKLPALCILNLCGLF